MKELTIEQKAQRYDEAIERYKAKQEYESQKVHEFIEYLFPELKESEESEDERIRKGIISYLKSSTAISPKTWIAWLEKQGNLMKALRISNARIGELIEENYYLREQLEKQGEHKPVIEMKTPEESLGIDSDTYNKIVDECIYCEQKPAWSEEDEEMFSQISDILWEGYKNRTGETPTWDNIREWCLSIKDRVQPKQEWKQENTGDLTDFENTMMHIGESFFGKNAGLDPNDTNVIKEQANLLLELVPNKEWSEEDKRTLQGIIGEIEANKHHAPDCDLATYDWFLSWLKSLKERYTWKPSKKQLYYLSWIANIKLGDSVIKQEALKHLSKLYEQLKQL